MEVMQYFSILGRWYRLIVGAGLLAAAAVLVVSYLSPPVYVAEADVAIVDSGAQVDFGTRIQTISDLQTAVDQTARRKSLTTIAESPDIAAAVIAKIGDRLDAEERVPAELLKSIGAVNDGDLVRITATANTPDVSALVANTWAQEYQTRVNAIYADNPLSPTEIRSQADAAKREYDQKEAALVAYVRDNPIDDLTREIAQKQQSLNDLVAAANKLDRLLADSKSLRDHLAAGKSGNGLGDDLAQVLLEAAAFSTTSNLPTGMASSTQLSTGQTAGDQPTTRQSVSIQSNILQPGIQNNFLPVNLQLRVDQLSASTPADQLSTLDALLSALQDRRNSIQPSALSLLQQEINQLDSQLEQENAKKGELTRARDLAWTSYTTLASKVAEVNIAQEAKGSVVRLAVPAVPPDQPLASGRLFNSLLAGLVGLLVGAGAAFFIEYMDDSLRTPAEIETLIGISALGAVPDLVRTGPDGKGVPDARGGLAVQEPQSSASEAFRLLRYNLFAPPDKSAVPNPLDATQPRVGKRAILIASATPAEGKSTVAANLAASIAQTGKGVTLVDADLRRPSQHEVFRLKNSVGLSDVLSGSTDDWRELAQATEVGGLRVITSGPAPADPTRLLEGDRLGKLVEKLKTASDVIIIDSPAVLGLADATLAARAADAVLLIVKSGSASRGDVLRAKQTLGSTGVPIAGAVLNWTRELPGAATYKYYARSTPPAQANSNGHTGIRERLVELVAPRR